MPYRSAAFAFALARIAHENATTQKPISDQIRGRPACPNAEAAVGLLSSQFCEYTGSVPSVRVVLYRELDGRAPFLEWLDKQPGKVQDKCRVRIERLSRLGHELRRPESDYLRDGIYELRASFQGVHYRILYFFHGTVAAVLSHGLAKEQAVPAIEIQRAIERKQKFELNPAGHTYEGSQS